MENEGPSLITRSCTAAVSQRSRHHHRFMHVELETRQWKAGSGAWKLTHDPPPQQRRVRTSLSIYYTGASVGRP